MLFVYRIYNLRKAVKGRKSKHTFLGKYIAISF